MLQSLRMEQLERKVSARIENEAVVQAGPMAR